MKKAFLTLAATAAALVSVSTAAGAAPFQPLYQRTQALEQKINLGLRSGALTRAEGDSLRVGLARIRLIEAQYRRGGIDRAEQQDLDRRFDNLARHVRVERSDRDRRDDRGFQPKRGYQNDRPHQGSYADRGRQNGGGYSPNRDYRR